MSTPALPDVSAGATPSRAHDRLAHGLILGAGTLCFLLLAWGHLGLGALLFPPPRTVARQVASAGPLKVALALDSGQLTAAGPNTVVLTITDQAGRPITQATATAHPVMTTMAMEAPSVVAMPVATPDATGQYSAQPRFAMAGDWRLVVTITRPGYAPQAATFPVTVRWK